MAKAAAPGAPAGGGAWLLPLAVLGILAVLTGAGLGLYLVSEIEKTVQERAKAEQQKPAPALAYKGDLAVKPITPIVTNLASGTLFIRVEASLIVERGAAQNQNIDVLVAEIRQDVLAYLRTVSLAQIEGASGLQHLREDLNERAVLRAGGVVRELVLESLVVQ